MTKMPKTASDFGVSIPQAPTNKQRKPTKLHRLGEAEEAPNAKAAPPHTYTPTPAGAFRRNPHSVLLERENDAAVR